MNKSADLPLHLFGKFRQGSVAHPELGINTIQEHRRVAEAEGWVWWGTGRTFATEIIEHFKRQMGRGVLTKVYLYEIETQAWYLARLQDVSDVVPKDRSRIPEYYRNEVHASYLKLKDLKEFRFQGRARHIQNPLVYVYEEDGEGPPHLMVASSGRPVVVAPGEPIDDSIVADVEDLPTDVWTSLSVEKDLENYIAAHPDVLEAGLTLVKQQYETGVGRIDILFQDSESSRVVVETKKGREADKVVGQLLRYMGWIQVQEEEPVRGIIVTSEPDARLEYAAAAVPNVRLVTYRVRFDFARHDTVGDG